MASAILTAAVTALLLSSCATTAPGDPSPSGAALPTSVASRSLDDAAKAVVVGAVLPDGARLAGSVSQPGMDQAPEQPACDPLIDESEFAAVADEDPATVSDWLRAHPTPGFEVNSWGSQGTIHVQQGWIVIDTPVADDSATVTPIPSASTTSEAASILYLVKADGAGGSVVRVDAQIVPPGADCARVGGPAPVRSPTPRSLAPTP